MQKLNDLLGLPVLECETGSKIGEVREVILDLDRAAVWGMLLNLTEGSQTNEGILFRDVYNIGRDAVTIRITDMVTDLTSFLETDSLQCLQKLVNKTIFTEAGLNLGVLVDILFDVTTGEVKNYEVSDGIITDFIHGRMVMPLPQAQVIGEDKLIVPEVMAKLLQPGLSV